MLPHFLAIGAPRTGSTWLHQNLLRHPQVWLPPIKEVHFFDRPNQTLKQGLLGPLDVNREARRAWLRAILVGLPRGRLGDALWWTRFVFRPRSEAWYESLFPVRHPGMVGDVTPSYAQLDGGTIARIHELMPDARMIYVLRNPIEMIWSLTVRLNMTRRRFPMQTWSRERMIAHLTAGLITDMADYAANLERWEKLFDPARILVAFHNDLKKDPAAFYRGVLRFLDLDDVDDKDIIVNPVNEASREIDPTPFLPVLAVHHHDNIVRAHRRFQNDYTAEWVEMAERLIRDNPT